MAYELAATSIRWGRFIDRFKRAPKGLQQHLAIREACDLSWLGDHPVQPERVSLWLAMRTSSITYDLNALQQTAWTVRHLLSATDPLDDLQAFLDRKQEAGGDIDRCSAIIMQASGLSPIVRACYAHSIWTLAELGKHGARIEGAVLAQRLASSFTSDTGFLPMASAGSAPFSGASAYQRLVRWLDGAGASILRAMRILDDYEHWGHLARASQAIFKVETRDALIDLFLCAPYVTTALAMDRTGLSKTSIVRHLTALQDNGIVREITGQNRFKIWVPKSGH
ncbi:hypothetical protein [Thioclava kandeliae]|uniref:HTH DNA binding domain-containing protein n=1 Tax=Thioclava kandeliae TaxID=3070818 RepID=A0ABV1SN40_9RHOB